MEGEAHTPNADGDYLSTLIGRLSAQNQDIVARLSRVKNEYVEFGRDKLLRQMFDRFLVDVLSSKIGGVRSKGQAFFVTGDSGAGKSEAVERLLRTHPVLQPIASPIGSISPYVSISLVGAGNIKTLGTAIAKEAGYETGRKLTQGDLWDQLPRDLKHYGVFLVHIDEAQHMLKQSELGWKAVANALKGSMNHSEWPVSYVLSGMPEVTRLLRLDGQMERREYILDFPSLAMPDERVLVERLAKKLCEAADLDSQALIASDVPDRIAHAANYQVGRVAQVICLGIHHGLLSGQQELTREHFALAFLDHSQARGLDGVNPFLVDDWENLMPGWFIPEGEKNAA